MGEKKYSKSIAKAVGDFLERDDWEFFFDKKKGIYSFGLSTGSVIKRITYIVHILEHSYLVYLFSPIGINCGDKSMTKNMTEFLCRANYGLKNGNFEIDLCEGEIRFKSFVDCQESIPSERIILNSIYFAAGIFDKYTPGIIGVIFQGLSGKEAIDVSEKMFHEELRLIEGGGGNKKK